MIALKRLGSSEFVLSANLIERVEPAPGTMIAMIDATRYIMEQTVTEAIELIREDQTRLPARVEELIQEDNQKTTIPMQLSVACSSPGKEEQIIGPASIVGMVGAMIAVVAMLYMEGSHLTSILLPPPMILAFDGILLTAMTTFTMKDFIYAFSRFPKGLTAKLPGPTEATDTTVSLSERVRHEGLLALEDAAEGIDGTFTHKDLMSATGGTGPEELHEVLGDEVEAKKESNKGAYEWLKQTGGYSPAIGIIDTVVSLMHVLTDLSNPETLGLMTASAFVATLWGLLSMNMIRLPMSGRLQRISQLGIVRMEVIAKGLVSLQFGASPCQAGECLRSLIPPSQLRSGKEGKTA